MSADLPYTLCGQKIARQLGGGGFSVERVKREGDTETRQVVSK